MPSNRITELSRLNDELKQEVAERSRTEAELEERNRLLATLLDVSNLVSSTLELKPLLESILDRLRTIIEYKGAKIMIIEGEALRTIARRSILPADGRDDRPFLYRDMPLSRSIITGRRPMVITDVREDGYAVQAFGETPEDFLGSDSVYMRSWMGIPMIIKDRVIGMLTLNHSEPGFYLPGHAEIGMAFASQAAIEYENARLYNETVKRADELKTMFAVQQAITSRLKLDEVLQMIADESKRLTLSARTAVFLANDGELVLSVFSGKDGEKFLGYRMPIEGSLAGRAFAYGKPLLVNDAQNDPDAYPGLVEKAGIRSFLYVPLITGNRPMGAIAVADKLHGQFDSEDERILSMLASTAIISIENARMYQEEHLRHIEDEQRRRVAEGLRDVLAILNSNRPLVEILEYITTQAVRLMHTDTGALYRLAEGNGTLAIEAACGLPEEFVESMDLPAGAEAVGQAVLERKPVLADDIAKGMPERGTGHAAGRAGVEWLARNYRNLLAIPLICKDETYGAIVLYYREQRAFTREEMELAVTFADQAALAIDNARLRAQAEQAAVAAERSRLARDLHDAVTQTLFAASLIAEVLPKIWERSPEEGRKRLEELRQLTRGALAEMRTLLLELRPATLTETGIGELLKHLVEAAAGRARIPVDLQVDREIRLPEDVKIALYRIAQEALNNISKHSNAHSASVVLRRRNGRAKGSSWIELIIRDDGCGFHPQKVTGDHLGLKIMRERAEAAGAKLSVKSEIKRGTEIIIRWEGREV